MNARKAVLADNPELILRVLQLRFNESLSYPRISVQTGVSKTTIFSLVRRFHQVFTDWPLSGAIPFSPTVTQPVKTEKTRRNRFSPEFKWRLVQQTTSLLPVTLTPGPDNKIPTSVQIPEQMSTPRCLTVICHFHAR